MLRFGFCCHICLKWLLFVYFICFYVSCLFSPKLKEPTWNKLLLTNFFSFFSLNFEFSMQDPDEQVFPSTITAASSSAGRSNVINRVTQEQSKWKRQVQEQRRTVYDKHALLNWFRVLKSPAFASAHAIFTHAYTPIISAVQYSHHLLAIASSLPCVSGFSRRGSRLVSHLTSPSLSLSGSVVCCCLNTRYNTHTLQVIEDTGERACKSLSFFVFIFVK